jgi:hypothetical protein
MKLKEVKTIEIDSSASCNAAGAYRTPTIPIGTDLLQRALARDLAIRSPLLEER